MSSSADVPSRKIPVIIDTDPGVDDTLAILLALASPELEILAIIISFGNTDTEASYANILKIYQALARHIDLHPQDKSQYPNYCSLSTRIILAKGADRPLEGDLHSAEYFHGRDGLAEISQRHPDLNVQDAIPIGHPTLELSDKWGPELTLELIRSRPARSVTYLALGPLTNLAHALRLDGDLVRSRIGRVVCMGGALDVPGNTSPLAEFNFFADPYAVRELLTSSTPGSGLPLERFLLLPLDITTSHELPFPYYKDKVDASFQSTAAPSQPVGKPPLVHFTSSFMERTREIMIEFGKDAMELHDVVAVWCAIENPPVEIERAGTLPVIRDGWKVTRRRFEVERLGELTRGMLVVDRRDDQGAYDPGANRAQVQAELEQHHFHHAGAYESTALPAQVELERPPVLPQEGPKQSLGVPCIVKTPGPSILLTLMLKRIWGVEG